MAGTGEGLAPCSCTWRPPAGLLPHCGGRPTSRPGLGCFVLWAVASPLSQAQPQLHLLQEACGPSQAGGSVLRPHSPSDDQVALT